MKKLMMIAAALLAMNAYAGNNLDSDMDSLGGNKDIMERANAINPENRIKIVQKRAVSLDNRLEFLVSDGLVAGGEPYLNSNDLGAQLEYHFNPRWSVGARYYQIANSLSSEGSHYFNQLDSANQPRPVIDYPRDSYFGTVTFAPFYGKLDFADLFVTQFDVYLVGGYGVMDLQSGTTPTYTGGIGVAFWWSQHWSTHFEARYQGYTAAMNDGSSEQVNQTILGLGIGFLF